MFSFVFNLTDRTPIHRPGSDLEYIISHVFYSPNGPSCGKHYRDPETALRTFADPVYAAARAYYEYINDSHKPQWYHIQQMLCGLHSSYGSEEHFSQLRGMSTGAVCVFPFLDARTMMIFRKQDQCTLYEQLELDRPHAALGEILSYPELAIAIHNETFHDGQFQSELTNFLHRMNSRNSYLCQYDGNAKYPLQYTTQILAGILCAVGHPAEVTRITKRVVHCDMQSREKLWFLIKVAIQSSLDRARLGRSAYKTFMLFFMLNLANHATNTSLPSELLHMMSVKILRRFRKLGTSVPEWLSDAVVQTCTRLSDMLDSRSIQAQIAQRASPSWNPSQLNLAQDIQLSLPYCSEHLPSSLTNPVSNSFNTSVLRFPLRGTLQDFISSDRMFFDEAYRQDPHVALYDVEHVVEQGIDDWVACISDVDQACIQLEVLVQKYLSGVQRTFGVSFVQSRDPSCDPEHVSIAILTTIELWVALDKLVVEKYPILMDYSPEIPIDLFNRLLLRKTTSLHHFVRAHRYLSARHAKSRPGLSVFSHQFTEQSFPVRYFDSSLCLQDLARRIERDGLPVTEPLHMKVVLFELQCPVSFETWRSATIRILDFCCHWEPSGDEGYLSRLHNSIPIAKVPELRRYIVKHQRALISLAHSSESELLYVIYGLDGPRQLPWPPRLGNPADFAYKIPSGLIYEQEYLIDTTHTANNVLAAQANCHTDLTLREFITFGHLRSGGSLQWMNVLREVRNRSLNFRRQEVHLLLAQASTQVGPLGVSGELIWHQELQDESFCRALLNELQSLSDDVSPSSSDGPVMGTISMLASLLTRGPSEAILQQTIQLLRKVRERTFDWVNELLFDVNKSPTNEEHRRVLWNMCATCRSTFDVEPAIMCKLLHSSRDIEIALTCALLMHTEVPVNFQNLDTASYSRVLLERDCRLSHTLEDVLRNAILADTPDFGIDLAVRKCWPGYQPGPHQWKPLNDPNSHWITCKTAETRYRRSQQVHVNLLDGSLLLDGRQISERLPSAITEHPAYRVIFGDQNFRVIPSDLPGMDFVTLFMISEQHVHFSHRSNDLIIRAWHKDTEDIHQLIPQEHLRDDLPVVLIKGHAHWLNLSTHIIEIRPLGNLWVSSSDNWRVNCASRPYRMTKGQMFLVDIHSPTWNMVSDNLRCLDIPGNLIITSTPVDRPQSSLSLQLSITLPRYGLSFFVNEDGDLESCDFKNMVCDENQCIGTLIGLVNQLVLCSKKQIEDDVFPRFILVPDCEPRLGEDDHQICIMNSQAVMDSSRPDKAAYHIYKVDSTLGCLTGISSLTSRMYLASLHAMTNNACRPDPLTGRTGIEEAISLAWLAGDFPGLTIDRFPPTHIPRVFQLEAAIEKIGLRGPVRSVIRKRSSKWDAVLQEAYLYPSEVAVQLPMESQVEVGLRWSTLDNDLVYTVASVVDQWSLNAPILNDLSSWAEAWGDIITGDKPSSQLGSESTPLRIKIYNLLGGHGRTADRATRRFQLLFSLPAMVYSSENPQATLLSTLIAFAKQPHIRLENPPHYTGYNLSDGYHPQDWQIHHHLSAAYSDGTYWPTAFDTEVKQLLLSWPSETIPALSLDPDRFDMESLNASLQSYFSSLFRNLKLKEYLTQICCKPASLHPHPLTCTLQRSFDWQLTLNQLLRERPTPDLPRCHRLPHGMFRPNDAISSSDIARLGQLFSSLAAGGGASEFQKQYVARLQASAHHVLAEEIRTVFPSRSEVKPTIETLREHYVKCKSVYITCLDDVKKTLGPRTQMEQILDRCGQWPRATPYILFRSLASTSPIKPPGNWKKCLISLALLALEFQRARRLLQFAIQNLEEELFTELENEGGEGWIAAEHPDWLLIQMQGDFLIRRVQVEVAKEMMDPRSKKNTVMQVNMGAGKSSVVIPICAAALADTSQAVRVIVPKALRAQMLQLLANRLGGLVGMPIHSITLSRFGPDPPVDCVRSFTNERGILVMTPEDILALKLNCVDKIADVKIRANSSSVGQKWGYKHLLTERWLESVTGSTYVNTMFRDLKRWLSSPHKKWIENGDIDNHDRTPEPLGFFEVPSPRYAKELQTYLSLNARDIIDESDEIFHPRFQMVYTIGLPQHLDGFPDRWAITQKVLRLVNRHAYILSTAVPHQIECERSTFGSFPRLCILQADSEKQFLQLITEDVVRGHLIDLGIQYLPQQLQDAIYSFVSLKGILPETTKIVKEFARNTTSWNALLLLRGLLADNILLFALTERRWRVDYGLDPSRTMLAVPYRAKDVPAARAEFGHPDLTILLTCLSYYYGGLNEEQLRISFEILLEQDSPSSDYAVWLEDYNSGTLVDALRDLRAINIRSSAQWEQYIFPLFSRNQGAIDFYLTKVVFPKHAKEYPWKISGSSWDIAEWKSHFVTGFSGTNDAQYLLPTSIHQDDPDYLHQTGTNARVLANILHPDNNSYMITASENGGRWTTPELLRAIVAQEPEIRVLLDVGAQILDLSNRAIAETWLNLTSAIDTTGAIYFNNNDELVVLSRDGTVQPLSSSPFVQHLDQCVAYLDDVHTRGTDIKFPRGFRAAVTLGVKVTKDRLAQGCMRMRKLGHDHSVMFFASPEVDCRIRSLIAKDAQTITPADILHWTIRETWSDILRWAPHWTQQGMTHKSQHEVLTRFLRDELTPEQLAACWLQPEIKSLDDLYAPRHHPVTTHLSGLEIGVRQRCKSLGISPWHPNTFLDEEREREVSREIEREREAVRPPKAEPAKHALHPDVVEFVRAGVLRLEPYSTAFRPVFTTLAHSSAAATGEPRVWSPYILATADFCRTIVESSSFQGRVDPYLRPVQWVLSGKMEGNDVLVLLSPFEADQLMPYIRVSEHVHLHLYAPRTTRRMKPSDDLKLYTVPPVPSDWTPPWALIDQLNVFAGQLYLRDYSSYVRLCRFLGVHTKDLPDEKTPVLRNWFNIPGAFEPDIDTTFDQSPLPFVMMLLAIRNRGMPFAKSHMGSILRGQLLTEKDFEEPAPPIVHYGME